MATDPKQPLPKFHILSIVAILVLAVVLFSIGYSWVRSAPPVPGDEPASVLASTTIAAVSSPTAITTSIPPTIDQIALPGPTVAPTHTALPTEPPLPFLENPPSGEFQDLATLFGSELAVIDQTNTGIWQFPEGSFVHPIALEVGSDVAYMIDAGRVLQFDLQNAGAGPPRVLLASGDKVEDVPVLEPLDLTLSGEQLLVLDRASDVYRFDVVGQEWQLDRYDRPVEDSSGHYMVAIASAQPGEEGGPITALLETNYKFAQLYDAQATRTWRLPERRQIDVAYQDGDVFVLEREMHEELGAVAKYRDTGTLTAFAPRVKIERPRQLLTSSEGIYVLDQAGRRLLLLDSDYGQLLRVFQLPQDDPVSVVAVDHANGRLLLAGSSRLYFVGLPEERLTISGKNEAAPVRSYDRQVLEQLVFFTVPIGGSNITFRDFQMPGAPRHYRLGIHHGFDLYWQPGTRVLAAADGVIVRADNDYQGPTATELATWSEITRRAGYTTDDMLDKYLGRQVWIEHSPGIVSRYAHLRSIEPGIVPGTVVSRGQALGEVGNSGSPASLESEFSDAHLHFELWLDDHYLGQYLRPIEAREWIEELFPASRD